MIIRSQAALADLFGVTDTTIQDWQSRAGFPVRKSGAAFDAYEYDSAEVIAWYVAWKASDRGETPNDRLARVRADAIEMDNAERRRTLIPADQLEPKLKAAIVAAREAWRAEPARLAREVAGLPAQEAEDLMSAAFDAFLVRLSHWQHADEEESDE